MKCLKLADQFGVQFTPPIEQKDQQFKSYIGGMTSFVIYSLAFVYFLIQMIQWQTNQIIPIVSNSIQKIEQLQYNISSLTISNTIQGLNPFDPKAQILIPLIGGYQPFYIKNGTFTFQNLNLNLDEEKQLFLANCTSYWEEQLQIKCASDEQIVSFYSELNQIQFSLELSKYDLEKKQFKPYKQSYNISIDPGLVNLQQMVIQTGNTQVQDGFILVQTSNILNIYDVSFQCFSQSTTYIDNYVKKSLKKLGLAISSQNIQYQSVLLLSLSKYQQSTIVQYPLLGTILANVGSIVSLLMLLSKIIIFFNQIQLEKYMMQKIICFYYPQFKQIQVHQNIWSKNIKFTSKDNKIQYDNENLEQIYRRSQEIAQNKINYLNIIYELSRLQFVIQSLQDRQLIIQSQDVGIRLPPLNIIQDNSKIKMKTQILNIDEIIQKKNQQIFSNNGENQLIQENQNDHDKLQNQNQGDANVEQKNDQINNKFNYIQNDSKFLIDSDMQLLMIPDLINQQSENNTDRKILPYSQKDAISFYQSNIIK